MSDRWFIPISLTLIAALLAAGVVVRGHLLEERRRSGLSELELTKLPPVGAASLLLMGGFRGVAVDILWLRVNTLHIKREYEEEISLIELITRLQPYYVSVWIFQGWNIAYNISVQHPDLEQQWQYIRYGIDFVKRGLELNPDNVDLLFYLAHLHRDKVHQNEYFEKAMARDMGVNNLEVAAEYYRRARQTGASVRNFARRVVDSGVWHSYHARIMQIFKEDHAELSEDLEWSGETVRKVNHFLDICRRETAHLNERWTRVAEVDMPDGTRVTRRIPDAAFEMFPIRDDLVWFDGFLIRAEETLKRGKFSDAAYARAERILDKAWVLLRRRILRFDPAAMSAGVALMNSPLGTAVPTLYYGQRVLKPYETVVRNKINDAVSGVAMAMVRYANELLDTPYLSLDEMRRALSLYVRALNIATEVQKSDYVCRDQQMLLRGMPVYIHGLEERIRKRAAAE